MTTLAVRDITIAFDDEGSGEALLLVHGHPFNRSMWRPQLDHFSGRGWRVIAPDLRGYGESSVVPGKTTLEMFARDLKSLLDVLEIDTAVVGGLSMGGQIVMEFQRLFPEAVRGLVLAATFPQAETDDGRRARNETADRLLREGMAPFADEVLPKMITPHNIAMRPSLADSVLEMMRTTPPEGAAAALRGRAERRDYVEMLAEISVPVLVVAGREDAFTPTAVAADMHERITRSTFVVIDGAGHMPNVERPAEFNAALERFLAAAASAS